MKWKLSQRVSLLSAILAIPATALFAWLIMRVLYQKMPEYTEFVTGYTSWTAYFKSGDMTLAYLVIGGVLGFYVLFAVLLSLLSKKCVWLTKNVDNLIQYRPEHGKLYKKLENYCYLFIFAEFSIAAIARAFQMFYPKVFANMGDHFWIGQILFTIALCIVCAVSWKKDDAKAMKTALERSQMFLPMVFICISRYEYIRNGEVIVQYESKPMIVAMGIFTLALLAYNVYRINWKDKNAESAKIYVSSFLSIAVFASYTLPKGTISGTPLEMYHYGELSGPLHQFLNFGTIPYIDTMPIHGVCDYFQAGIWYTLFDGTYASFEAAMIIGCVAIALVTALVYYYFVENKLAALVCILLFSLFGDKYYYVRWAFALPFILIVFSEKVRKDFPKLLWYWTFISILSIAWNPSIGGSCALAALPMVLYECFHEKGWKIFLHLNEKEVRKKILPLYIPLLILGICFIPMFFAILRYIVENSAAILETTGDILREELKAPFVWYATFGFALSLLASCYHLVGKKGEDKKLAVFALLFLIIFNSIIVRYTFVRTQYGERGIIVTTICSLFLILMVFLPYIKEHCSTSLTVITLLLFVCTVWSKGANVLEMPGRLFDREEISEAYIYASVEETGIPGLGNIYITEEQKNTLMNLNEIANNLCGDGLQYVDMTNQLAQYNILNKKVLLPFSSTYNTNNKVMQTKAIEVLKELQPEVIVVSPHWQHDSASLSTRNYYLYQYLAKHYEPCKYENIIFLTNNEEVKRLYEPAFDEFAELMHVERLKMLPACWGNEYLEHTVEETYDILHDFSLVDTNAEKLGNNRFLCGAEETYFLYGFESPIAGIETQFLRIGVEDLSGSEEELKFEGVVYFMDEGKGLKEGHRFIYDGGEGEFLIPLSTSPYWSYSKNISAMLVDFIHADLPGKEMKITLEFENLNWEE